MGTGKATDMYQKSTHIDVELETDADADIDKETDVGRH